MSTFILGVIAGLVLGAAALFLYGYFGPFRPIFTAEGRALVEAYTTALRQQVQRPSPQALTAGAIKGMFQEIGDPYSYYYPPNVVQKQRNLKGGFYVGVGIGLKHAGPLGAAVDLVDPGSPADRAGVQVNDALLVVAGRNVSRMPANDVQALLAGAEHTSVTLQVRRGAQTLAFSLPREKRKLNAVQSRVLEGRFGYIRILNFTSDSTVADFKRSLTSLRARGIGGMVLDLRNNTGGRLQQATEVADSLLEKGTVLDVRDPEGKVVFRTSAHKSGSDYLGPLVVLVEKETASAGEVLAAALQDNKRATLIGERTFGKNVANRVVELANGAELVLAVDHWLTPNGKSIAKTGVEPDIKLKAAGPDDAQLHRALEILK